MSSFLPTVWHDFGEKSDMAHHSFGANVVFSPNGMADVRSHVGFGRPQIYTTVARGTTRATTRPTTRATTRATKGARIPVYSY